MQLQKHYNTLSYCNLTIVSIEHLSPCCYFSHCAKSTPLFIYYGFQDQSYHRSWSYRKQLRNRSWEAKNLIAGLEYIVDNFKTCHVKSTAVTEFTVIGINIKFAIVLVFESQTLSYKPNPISYEKSPKLLCLILKKLLGL